MIHRSLGLCLVSDKHVFSVEVEDAELFDIPVGHRGLTILQQRVPRGQDRLFQHPRAGHAVANGLHQFQLENDLIAHALDLLQARGWRRKDVVQITEFPEKGLGQWLRVTASDGTVKHHFQKLVVRHGVSPAIPEPLAQTLPVGMAVRFGTP